TSDYIFTQKFPATIGRFHKDIVAGHIGTSSIAGNRDFNGVYYDGYSHYYIDGTVNKSGVLNVLMFDTDTEKYYCHIDGEYWPVEPYGRF
ncbi:MAG: hypothetical protein ACI4WM_07330, partial [Erysipelotrichaceae bacterium]